MTALTAAEIDALPLFSIVEERSVHPSSTYPVFTVFIRREGGWRGTNGSIVANSRFFRRDIVHLIREGEPA